MSTKKLKSMDEHNAGRYSAYQALRDSMQPHPNGIACPRCGKELWDSAPNVTLTSYPAQKHVHCPSCGYRGFALA